MTSAKYLIAALGSFVLGVLMALALSSIADPLAQWEDDWRHGRAFAENPDYQELYAHSTDRQITWLRVGVRGENVVAMYEANLLYDGKPLTQRGIAVFWVKDGVVVKERHREVTADQWSRATTGQVTDAVTTLAGVSAGFSEIHPAGLGVLVIKGVLLIVSDGLSFEQCIDAKRSLGGFGWGAAAWNVAVMAGAPVVALPLALVALWWGFDYDAAWFDCAEGILFGENDAADRVQK